jgi:nucleoside phosphorylase
VFVALAEEMKSIYNLITASKRGECRRTFSEKRKSYFFELELRSGLKIDVEFLVMSAMGNLSTASYMASTLVTRRPNICVLVGIAGSLDPTEFKLGDVIISTSAKFYSPDKVKELAVEKERFSNDTNPHPDANIEIDVRKKVMDRSFFRFRRQVVERDVSYRHAEGYVKYWDNLSRGSRPKLEGVDQSILADPQGRLANQVPTIHVGSVLGSDWVIDSQEYVDFIRQRNIFCDQDYYKQKANGEFEKRNSWNKDDVAVVDMETWGFLNMAEAASEKHVHFFSVRGVSDFSSNKSWLDDTSESEVRRIAAANAMEVTWDLIDYLDRQA